MEIVFWVLFGIVFYIFLGYPVVVFIISKIYNQKPQLKNSEFSSVNAPTVTLIITVYNEEKNIQEKIKNTLAIDYPKNKLEIIICSDASDDMTDVLVQQYAHLGIRLLRVEGRVGKTECQNQSVMHAQGDIVIFSDANSMYDTQAVKNLVRNFSSDQVGCVVGELRYIKNGTSNEGVYWNLEQMLKKSESAIDSCLGANGAIYAVRKSVYTPLPVDSMSDFIEPFTIYRKKMRVIYDTDAFCYEDQIGYHDEFKRKQRVILRALQSLYLITDFFNPFRYGWYSIMFWSHKIIRWNAFVFTALLFIVSVVMIDYPYMIYFIIIQILFYLCAFLGKYSRFVVFRIPYGFMQVYSASFLAIMYWILGKKIITWKTVR